MSAPWIDASVVIDDFTADELYVDGYRGISYAHGVVKLNLTVDRLGAGDGELKSVVVKRLALSLPNFLSVLDSLNLFAGQLERDGLIERSKGSESGGVESVGEPT